MEKKVGRNDPCPCGSGKKFKKCCEAKMTSQRTIGSAEVIQGTSKMASLFQRKVTPVTPQPPPPEAPTETPPDEKHLNM